MGEAPDEQPWRQTHTYPLRATNNEDGVHILGVHSNDEQEQPPSGNGSFERRTTAAATAAAAAASGCTWNKMELILLKNFIEVDSLFERIKRQTIDS